MKISRIVFFDKDLIFASISLASVLTCFLNRINFFLIKNVLYLYVLGYDQNQNYYLQEFENILYFDSKWRVYSTK